MRRAVRTALCAPGALVALALSACQGAGVPTSQIPEDPIAMVYREPELARRRAEALLEAQDPTEPRQGVAQVERIADYVADLVGARPADTAGRFAGQLALLNPRTGDVDPVQAATRGAIPLEWSADHRRLLFAQQVAGRLQVFEIDVVEGVVRQITRGPDTHPRGCYGPDGSFALMAVGGPRGAPEARILLSAPESGRSQVISEGPTAHSPACAPDGSALAWVSTGAGGRDRIVVKSPAIEGPPRELVPGRDPTFTPDGRWIVYSAQVAGAGKLFRIRPDGSGRSRIGSGALAEQRPAISPDGRYVVYLAELGVRERLYLRRFDGSGDRLLFRDGDGAYPVW